MNIAVRTGKESNIFVLDIDVKGEKNGLEWVKDKEAEQGTLPSTLTTRTPSGGLHYYFKYPRDLEVGCSNEKMASGVDIKGNRGYVLTPPSTLGNGIYQWVDEHSEIASAPEWLLQEIAKWNRASQTKSISDTQGLTGFVEGTRDTGIFRYALCLRGKGLHYEEAKNLVLAKARGCIPPFEIKAAVKCLDSAYGYDIIAGRNFSDVGNAERLKDRYGSVIRYVAEYGQWIIFNGTHSMLSELGEIHQLATIVVRDIPNEVSEAFEEDKVKKYRDYSRKCESKPSIDKMIESASKLPSISIHADQLDSNDEFFGVQNGVIDLKTGRFREVEPEDFVTMQGLVVYDSQASCPRWTRFVTEIAEDPELASYLQRLVGYTLIGGNPEQIFVICHGYGANGK